MMMFAVNIRAFLDPKILLNVCWNTTVCKIFTLFIRIQMVAFFNCILVDAYAFILTFTNICFTYQDPTKEEKVFHIVTRICQCLSALAVLFSLSFYCHLGRT
jgi:hypothetical protein